MKLVKVTDRSDFRQSKRFYNQAGYLVLPDCRIACSGVLQYSEVKGQSGALISNGDLINVYRPGKSLKDCCKQFANLPVTLEHPEGQEVNPEIAKGLTVGALGSNPRYEEENGVGYIVNDIIIYDADAQKKIEDGGYEELSAGYSTAFREARGQADGEYYEAEQFLLEPNHVALVEVGRCGAECRVCDDNKSNPQIKEGEKKMVRKDTKQASYRYFMPVGDADEVVELTEEQAKSMIEKDPEIEIEEMDEDEVVLEEKTRTECDEDEEEVEISGVETETEDETEEEVEVEGKESTKDEDEEMTFSVQFDDGTVGKMDKIAYEHCQRFMEVGKRGDKKETSFAQGLILTNRASEVLGEAFSVEKYAKGDSFDAAAIKSAIVKKVFPNIVVRGIKADALDYLYKSAYQTFQKNRQEYRRDLSTLCDIPETVAAGDGAEETMAAKARKAFLDRLHGKSNN